MPLKKIPMDAIIKPTINIKCATNEDLNGQSREPCTDMEGRNEGCSLGAPRAREFVYHSSRWAQAPFGKRWGNGERAEAKKVFDAYVEVGGNFIDTADSYQFGESEEIVGECIAFAKGKRTADSNSH